MRKILVGVLSVAGLCAVVLALAASPASATKDVVTITSGADAGTYTVSWETLGNCDPGSGTSGGTGSATIVVADAGTGTGTPAETGVVRDDICNYEWSASLVKTDGSTCAATLAVSTDPLTNVTTGLVTVGDCNSVEDVTVTVAAHDPTATLDTGAVGETVFTVTATPTGTAGADPDDECNTVSGDTTVDAAGVNSVTLTVVDTTLNGGTCLYDIAVALPAGFAAGAAGSIVAEDVNPTNDATDNKSLTVSVASRTVYLVQNVVGDAGGVSVVYGASSACGATTGLPGALNRREETGGITTTVGSTIVELRRGRFNVSKAISGLEDGAVGWSVPALNDEGDGCEATVTVSGLPDGCSSSASQTADLEDSDDTVIIEFSVDCTPPAEEPPMEEPPMEELPIEELPIEEPPIEEPMGPKQDTPTG